MLSSSLENYLVKTGIDAGATKIYAALIKTGPTSALQLAKATKISRTQVYRHLESLQQNGLVAAENLTYGTMYRAQPLENIDGALADKQAQVTELRNDLPSMIEVVKSFVGSNGQKASIQHYYGVAGLKQANWNLTKAQKEFRVFESAHLSEHFDPTFAKRTRERIIEKDLTSYDLTNATKISLEEVEPINTDKAFIRHMDPKILTINFEMYIYDNTVTLLNYSKENSMALEIHHQNLSTMMRQIFDVIWNLGETLEIL